MAAGHREDLSSGAMTTLNRRSFTSSLAASFPRPMGLAAVLATAALTAAPSAHAAPVWTGDMETGDLSQWNTPLNGEHITVVKSPVLQGMYAAQIQLTNDAVWPNGLKRVELNHRPTPERTAEGAETYFAWSFYVPEVLPEDPYQEIGYWESDKTYQQMMAFDVRGEKIEFITRKPQNVVQWEADGKVTAATWHRIAIHVKWSKDATKGFVDVWFDGEQVVNKGAAQTLADDNSHFTQLGLLRGKVEFEDAPILLVDDAVEGDSVEDVHPALPMNEGGAGGEGGANANGSGGGGAGGVESGTGGGGVGGASEGGAGGQASGGAGDAEDEGGCGCRQAGSTGEGAGLGIIVGLAALAVAARRRGRSV